MRGMFSIGRFVRSFCFIMFPRQISSIILIYVTSSVCGVCLLWLSSRAFFYTHPTPSPFHLGSRTGFYEYNNSDFQPPQWHQSCTTFATTCGTNYNYSNLVRLFVRYVVRHTAVVALNERMWLIICQASDRTNSTHFSHTRLQVQFLTWFNSQTGINSSMSYHAANQIQDSLRTYCRGEEQSIRTNGERLRK